MLKTLKASKRRKNINWIILFLLLITLPIGVVAAPNEPEAFSNWFIQQDFQGQEYYQWIAVFEALTDGKDRSREVYNLNIEPVYVAIITGEKYHKTKECFTLTKSTCVLEMDISEEKDRGFQMCSKCER